MKVPISKRLLCCASFVEQGAQIADIGCDHGYLSIYLLLEKRISFAHASDLRVKPLEKAKENAETYGVKDSMEFSCADGLTAVRADSVDTVICAGMGADTIIGIIEAAPWLRNQKYCLILQPQSSGQDLRRYLTENGFGLVKESLVEDGGFIYTVLLAKYGIQQKLTPGQQYVSPQLIEDGSVLLHRYVDRIEKALYSTTEGIKKATGADAAERSRYYEDALREIQRIRQENNL